MPHEFRYNNDAEVGLKSKGKAAMKVPVIYFDGNPGKVASERLDDMIRRRLVMAFIRRNEWVNAANCRHRGLGGKYKGPERREKDD